LKLRRQIRAAGKWLASEFPNCFLASDPRPIKADVLRDIERQFNLTPGERDLIKHALMAYRTTSQYSAALRLPGAERIDLTGVAVSPVLTTY
jgi:sRNA-binding protein